MFLQQLFLVLLLLLAALLLVLLFIWLARRSWLDRAPPLKAHYLRLGRTAPDAPCPCGHGKPAVKPYRDCCRPRDVELLTEDARAFLWKHWSHRSFAGRRRSRSLQTRLEDFPLPPLVLPDWVEAPEKYTFPISEEELRAWSPLAKARVIHTEPVGEEAAGPGDLF